MITRSEVDAAAAGWAHTTSLVNRSAYEAAVSEFDLGFIVSTRPAGEAPTFFGGRVVVDRETGRVSTWPGWPDEVLQNAYRDKRLAITEPPRSWDPALQLRRETWRKVSPGVAAHLTLGGVVHIARGAKGDQRLHHHPLVLQKLSEQTPAETVRGCERHAELLVCSDVLHETDRRRAAEGRAPLTLDEARVLFRDEAAFETFRIREPGDPSGAQPAEPCESCVFVLTELALLPWAKTGARYEFVAPQQPSPDPRFSDEVASELLKGNWLPSTPHHVRLLVLESIVAETVAVAGLEHRHEPFPAVYEALGHTLTLSVFHKRPGAEQRARPFVIDPLEAAHSADVLADFGRVLGARLFPIGSVAEESILAIDEHGRVFDLDQAGEWFVAPTYLEALSTLILGRRTSRVDDEGTWDTGA